MTKVELNDAFLRYETALLSAMDCIHNDGVGYGVKKDLDAAREDLVTLIMGHAHFVHKIHTSPVLEA